MNGLQRLFSQPFLSSFCTDFLLLCLQQAGSAGFEILQETFTAAKLKLVKAGSASRIPKMTVSMKAAIFIDLKIRGLSRALFAA